MNDRHTLVMSDFHLCEADPSDTDWLWYRQRKYFPDADFEQLTVRVDREVHKNDSIEWVFAGDLFELDGPRVVDGRTSFEQRPRTENDAVESLSRIAKDHPGFFGTLANRIECGDRLVFIAGNHDIQLTFPKMQAAVRAHIAACTAEKYRSKIDEQVQILPWFYRTDDGIHIEHGHQYDAYCSYRNPIAPYDVATESVVVPTMGTLSFQRLVSRMGYFNPHDERTFMLTVPEYVVHWAKKYMFSSKSLANAWFFGALTIVRDLLRQKPNQVAKSMIRARAIASRVNYAAQIGVAEGQLHAHAKLFAEPSDERMGRVIRELHLDQVAMTSLILAGLFVAPWFPAGGLSVAALTVGALAVRESLFPRDPLDTSGAVLEGVAESIAELYKAKAVVFGHTHKAFAKTQERVFVANSGAWAPVARNIQVSSEKIDAQQRRPYVWMRRPAATTDCPLDGQLCQLR